VPRQPLGGWENGLSPKYINNFRQNTPELIIRDARRMLGLSEFQCEVLRSILLARGVNKWLRARLELIQLKNELKAEIRELHLERKWLKVCAVFAKKLLYPADYRPQMLTLKERMKVLDRIQSRIQRICHGERWVIWPRGVASPANAKERLHVSGPRS
jgi:hypothetical protein